MDQKCVKLTSSQPDPCRRQPVLPLCACHSRVPVSFLGNLKVHSSHIPMALQESVTGARLSLGFSPHSQPASGRLSDLSTGPHLFSGSLQLSSSFSRLPASSALLYGYGWELFLSFESQLLTNVYLGGNGGLQF